MKAIRYERFGGPEVLEYVDLPAPEPGSGQLLIETAAIGVNFPDIRERLGVYNQAETRVGGVQLPQVGGLAVAGTVIATGPQTSVPLGSRVVALMKKGAYAQLALAQEALCAVVSEDADLAALAGFAAQATCAHLLLQACTTLRPGESLLVHGAAGGVGGLAVQIAKALGAGPVIGTASTAERREFVMTLGADAALSYDEPGWTEQVRELTGGQGVDVLVESIGGDVFEQNFDALAAFGRYLLLGSTRGPGQPFAPRRLMTKSQALIGFYLPVFYQRPELIGNALRFLADGLRTGQIKSQVDQTLPLSQAAEAHRRLESRQVRGVIVLDPTARNAMTTKAEHRATAHTLNRIDIFTGLEYDGFVAAFEKAAPEFDRAAVQAIVDRGGSWDDVLAAAAANAPNDLMVYAKIDALPLLGLAGHTIKAVEYLLGNHTIAETMFRHDPKALLYAPLRLLIYADAEGNAVFSMDQPSAAFGSLGIAEVTRVGESLDRKVVNLLRLIGVDATQAFGR